MAIKAGQIVHAGNGVAVIDRIQTGGPGQLNIPTEKIYELGNYKTVATVRDTPDLTFTAESYDVSTEFEGLLTGLYGGRTVTDAVTDGTTAVTSTSASFTSADAGREVIIRFEDGTEHLTTIATVTNGSAVVLDSAAPQSATDVRFRIAGDDIDLAKARPIDIASQFKAGLTKADPFLVTGSVALPYLTLESMSYRFGLRDNATMAATLRGDTIFYNPGATFVETTAGTNTADQTIVTEQPAFQLASGDTRRVLSVTVGESRLNFGADYTESYGAVTGGAAVTTITLREAVPADEEIRICYSSPSVLQYPQSVHPNTTVKPAAVKGRDIEVYVGEYDPDNRLGSAVNKLSSVQGVTVDWRVTLEKDEEFGNYYAIGQDFETPEVSGTVDIKPRDEADFRALLRKVTGVTDPLKVIGPDTAVPLKLHVVIKDPETGAVIKRLEVDDARFTAPGFSGQVQQKLTLTLNWESDEGNLIIHER